MGPGNNLRPYSLKIQGDVFKTFAGHECKGESLTQVTQRTSPCGKSLDTGFERYGFEEISESELFAVSLWSFNKSSSEFGDACQIRPDSDVYSVGALTWAPSENCYALADVLGHALKGKEDFGIKFVAQNDISLFSDRDCKNEVEQIANKCIQVESSDDFGARQSRFGAGSTGYNQDLFLLVGPKLDYKSLSLEQFNPNRIQRISGNGAVSTFGIDRVLLAVLTSAWFFVFT